MPVGGKQILQFGPYQLDTDCGQLRKNGLGLKLQGQPVQILEILLERPGQPVTREELRQRLWSSDTFVDFDHSLNTAIKRLRQALGDEADTPSYIETIPKRGYRFIGEVIHDGAKGDGALAAVVDETVAHVTAAQTGAALGASTKSSSRRRWWTWAFSAFALFAGAAAIYWVTRPPRMPHIVGSHALTKTGFRKQRLLSRLLTDGQSIYFDGQTPQGWATMQVGVNGGEVSAVTAVDSGLSILHDIKSDRSGLLYFVQARTQIVMTLGYSRCPPDPHGCFLRMFDGRSGPRMDGACFLPGTTTKTCTVPTLTARMRSD